MSHGYAVHMNLIATGEDWESLQAHALDVSDQLDELDDANDDILDWTLGINKIGHVESDTGEPTPVGRVEVVITITAASQGRALDNATSLLRTAIHAAEGATPGWEDTDNGTGTVVYRIGTEDDESAPTSVHRLQDA